jgi:dTDP-4-amino-4,6-dideoxygalactose transaminase
MSIQVFQATFNVDECLKEIKECLDKGWTGMGFKTVEFEELWKKYTGLPNAYYVNSATAALNLAFDCLATKYQWSSDSEVISTPLTFVSTNHAILLAGLHVVFADVDDTFCLDPKSVEKHITPKTKAIAYVGVGGNTGHLDQIIAIAKKHHLKLVLDAAHMSGTRWFDGKTPGADDADVICYSYQAVKNLPTGDSGMVCFKDPELDAMARKKAWLGINKDTYSRTDSSKGTYKWRYDVEYVGNKYNGNAVMAAIAIAQLKELDKGNAYRKQIATWYDEAFKPLGSKMLFPVIPSFCDSSHHLYQILVGHRDELLAFLNENDIFPGVHYVDNTNYRMYAYAKGTCPVSNFISEHTLTLPMHLRLTYDDVCLVAQKVIEFETKTNDSISNPFVSK